MYKYAHQGVWAGYFMVMTRAATSITCKIVRNFRKLKRYISYHLYSPYITCKIVQNFVRTPGYALPSLRFADGQELQEAQPGQPEQAAPPCAFCLK